MKIYEKIVIDIETNTIVEEISYSYDGPVAFCGGGGEIPDISPATIRASEMQAESAREALQEYLLPSLGLATRTQYPWGKAGMEALGTYSQLMGLSPETWQWPESFAPSAYEGLYPPNVPVDGTPEVPLGTPAGIGAGIPGGGGISPAITPDATIPPAGGAMFPGQRPITSQMEWLRQTPGYQHQLGEGLRALQQQAGARGMRLAGPTMQGITDYAQNVASDYYQNYLNQLAGLWGGGQQTAAQLGGQALQGGQQAALAQAGIGQALGSGYAQAAQAQQQRAIAQQQQQQGMWGNILGGIGTVGGLGMGLWALSDKRTKKRIKPLNTLSIIKKLKPVTYHYKPEYGRGDMRIGFVADDVERVYPAAVAKDARGLRMIDSMAMNALNIKALQDQQQQIDQLKRRQK